VLDLQPGDEAVARRPLVARPHPPPN
jgi:hypothetical protein